MNLLCFVYKCFVSHHNHLTIWLHKIKYSLLILRSPSTKCSYLESQVVQLGQVIQNHPLVLHLPWVQQPLVVLKDQADHEVPEVQQIQLILGHLLNRVSLESRDFPVALENLVDLGFQQVQLIQHHLLNLELQQNPVYPDLL